MSSSVPVGSSPPASTQSPPSRSRRRRLGFRLAALLLGCLILLAMEGVCALFDWGRPARYDDPFVGFSAVHPLFEHDADDRTYSIAKSRRKFFAPDSFPVEKSSRTFRIFCLGGSTVQGRPFSKETSFTTWLKLALHETDANHTWEVVNCGGVSYASYRLVPILEECLEYEPDLFVICTGHNEFLEDRTYSHLRDPSHWATSAAKWLNRSRLYTLIRAGIQHGTRDDDSTDPARPVLAADADPMLDYQNGADAYRRDDAWRDDIIAHYEYNVRRMIALARERDVPVILVLPPSNLGDCPPFKSEPRGDLTEAQRTEFAELLRRAGECYRRDVGESIRLLRTALAIDNRHAHAWYELGQCLRTAGEYDAAREAFVKARDEDVCPLRMLTSLEEAMRRVAEDEVVPFLDAHELLEGQTEDGILDHWLIVDHIHPSFTGHQMIATELVEKLQELELAAPVADWRARCEPVFARHLASLDSLYFHNGQETLRAVMGWADGRAEGPAAQARFPGRFSRTGQRSK